MSKGKTLCIYGAKGGTGKTIITLNLAGTLANKEKKVIIIDLDLCNGAIAIALNKEINKTIYNFCDDYSNNRYTDLSQYITTYNDHIDFIAAPKDPRQANRIDIKYLNILLDKLSYMYDAILIDTTHYLNEVNIFAFDYVDKILFVTTNDPLDLKNLRNLITILKDNEICKYKILLNDSINPNKSYFTLFDMKNLIQSNIDYILSKKFNRNDMDNIILDGDIYSLKTTKFEDYKIFDLIASSLIRVAGVKDE